MKRCTFLQKTVGIKVDSYASLLNLEKIHSHGTHLQYVNTYDIASPAMTNVSGYVNTG